MKLIILAGGFGTRLSEYTEEIPKPMVRIGNFPIILHIMRWYSSFGIKDFNLALGYKASVIKEYFHKYRDINSDFSIDLTNGNINYFDSENLDWKITLIDTGLNSMTGGRVKRMQPYINNETFLLTYGDGLSNIDIEKLIQFHKSHGKMVTVSAVHPTARFGELVIKNNIVESFAEKPQTALDWINGGFFVIEPEFFELIDGDQTILEQDPLEKAAKMGELMAYEHNGFWQCMDTKRDLDLLETMWLEGDAPWSR